MNEVVERSIVKTYKKEIYGRFIKAIKDFKLINDGDKIAVCISGGKDSFLLAKCMQLFQKYGNTKFEMIFICMNPGYNALNLKLIKENSKKLEIDLHIFETDIFNIVDKQKTSPCYLCARMRRGYLYNEALKKGCNKIALGHHFNDVVETIVLNLFYASEYKTMMPKLHSNNFEGLELIRPLYYVREEDVNRFVKSNNLTFLNCACNYVNSSEYKNNSKRNEIKELINELKKKNKAIDYNIFKSTFNVNLKTLIGYYNEDESYIFLDNYKQNKKP
ncbi:MAG: tRNA 2-thiocytidine biosynthesis protein TtcA [Tenericutes bacterium]|nr:tRNA 2-thiocytidine biosynthesis protein TtcA [Mycoplasmatota bacterium]